MPPFPGLGYPLVPGYESVGRVVELGADVAHLAVGDRVFVAGASCFADVRCLFGGTASRLVVDAKKATLLPKEIAAFDDGPAGTAVGGSSDAGALLALAATAQHALFPTAANANVNAGPPCDLIVGHGVLGRLLARLVVAGGHDVTVWEKNPQRARGAVGYRVVDAAEDPRRDYRRIIDVSGDSSIVDTLVARLGRGGEIVLAGFYSEPLRLTFPPAFMREARLSIAAEFTAADVAAVMTLLASGALRLDGLITHRARMTGAADACEAAAAYATAFGDPTCLKMLIDWRAP
jgi:3-hydroxyethyl bacteriochlorophyllide a dehydrogenase